MGRNLPISWATRHGIATPKRPNLPRNERNSSHEASKFTIDHVYVSWSSPYQVLHVSDGFAALKMVRTLISQLILLDYLCPTWMAWSAWTGSERARGWDRHQSFS